MSKGRRLAFPEDYILDSKDFSKQFENSYSLKLHNKRLVCCFIICVLRANLPKLSCYVQGDYYTGLKKLEHVEFPWRSDESRVNELPCVSVSISSKYICDSYFE